MKSVKLKSYQGENVTDFCNAILVYADQLGSSGDFKHKNLVLSGPAQPIYDGLFLSSCSTRYVSTGFLWEKKKTYYFPLEHLLGIY